jgi:hypothetical protein
MNERQKRLIEVYEHLRRYFGIHTKTGFAEALHYGRTSMSAALNGSEKYLTDSLFRNICEAYSGTFNLEYLLNGEGELLMSSIQDKQKADPADHPELLNMLLASKQETIEALRRELEAKDEIIALLQKRVDELEAKNSNNLGLAADTIKPPKPDKR